MDNPENMDVLWEQFSSDLRSFIFSRIKNETDTDDILQNVFLKIHDNISNLKDSTKIKSWIYQITRNLIADHFRSAGRNFYLPEAEYELTVSTGSDRFMQTAVRDMIKMMDKLSPEYCEALCLTEIEGMSQKEYAVKAGISYSGAKSRVQRARIMLKDMLMQCCHYQFDKYGTVFDIRQKCCCCCD